LLVQTPELPRKFPEPPGVGASGKILRTSEVSVLTEDSLLIQLSTEF
jgi:hypothetical protein